MSDSDTPDSPKLPKTSGGTPFIVGAAVLAAAIGGVVYWKTSDTHEPAPAPPAQTVATEAPTEAPAPPILDSIPPPPPVEEVTEVEPAPAKTAAVKTPGVDPCAGPCRGSASAGLTQALSARAGSSRSCYERALQTNEGLQGKLVVQVRVDPSGRVCSTKLAEDGIGSQTVSSCVLGTFRGAKLPPPTGGCLDVNVPMSFVPRGGR